MKPWSALAHALWKSRSFPKGQDDFWANLNNVLHWVIEEDTVLNLPDATPTLPWQRFVLQMKSCFILPEAEHCARVGANTA